MANRILEYLEHPTANKRTQAKQDFEALRGLFHGAAGHQGPSFESVASEVDEVFESGKQRPTLAADFQMSMYFVMDGAGACRKAVIYLGVK